MEIPKSIQFRFIRDTSCGIERYILDAVYHGFTVARLEWLNGSLTFAVTHDGKRVDIDECHDLPVIMEKELFRLIENIKKEAKT